MQMDKLGIGNYFRCRKERYINFIFLHFFLHAIKNSNLKEMVKELLKNLKIYFRSKTKIGNLIKNDKKITTNKKNTTNNKRMANKKITTNKKNTTNNEINFIDIIFPKNAEENIKIIKNSHMKERAKVLLNYLKDKDFRTKNKIGSLYLFKNENFIISTWGEIKTYIGFSHDGTLVAVQCGFKNPKNRIYFTNEFNNIKNPKLESKNIIKYVSLEEDKDYFYIAVKLWDYYLDEYIENQPEIDQQKNDNQLKNYLKKIVEEMLLGLRDLHQAGVIHGDIKPSNIIIDSEENVRLIGFGRNIKLEEGETTASTDRAGMQENDYTNSSDIKAAGKLVYYILSGGKHLVIEDCEMQNYVQDIVAQDLINWMINSGPIIDQVLKHPYFWNQTRKEEVLRKVGDRPEVQYYTDISKACQIWKSLEGLTGIEAVERAFDKKDKNGQKRKTKVLGILGKTEQVQNENFSEKFLKLYDYAKGNSKDKTFSKWKSELAYEWPDIDKTCPEDLIGLLRTYRNKLAHVWTFDEQRFDRFPDFYISLHRLAKGMGWDCTWS